MQSNENSEFGRIPMYNNWDSCQNLAVTPDFGVDKLHSFVSGFDFEAPKTRPPGFTENIIRNDKGEKVKYFKNSVELKYNATIEGGYMNVNFNPSLKLHPYELTIDKGGIYEQYNEIIDDLRKSDVNVNVSEARVNRFDLAHNVILDNPIHEYRNVLDNLKGLRQIRRQHDTTRLWGNKQNQFIIYDKKAELTQKGGTPIELPDNFIRGEMRILKCQCIETTFGTDKLVSLLSPEIDYKLVYNHYIHSKLFRVKPEQLKIEYKELEFIYASFLETYGKGKGHTLFLKSFGVQKLLENDNAIVYLNKLIEINQKERTAYRLQKEINELIDLYRSKGVAYPTSYIILNQEFRTKLLAA